jgi:hypothetical protein
VPSVPVPVQPLLEGLARPYAMFKDYWKYDWVLPPHRYEGLNTLLSTLAGRVIAPAEAKVKDIGRAAARDRGGADDSSHVTVTVAASKSNKPILETGRLS